MTAFFIDIAVIFMLLLCNGFLAMTEMAIVSARKARLMQWAEDGDKKALLALEVANAPTKFLSSIQVGITLIALLTGIFGGATIADDLSERIKQVPHFAPHADAIAIGVVVTILTYISLIVGELVPKRIALSAPELIAKHVAMPMSLIQKAITPFVWLLSASTETVIRVLGIRQIDDAPMTEAEIQVLVEQATEAGVFEEVEQEMVESVLRLDDKRVSSLMTPRREIEWIDINDDENAWLETALSVPHSRLIIAQESLDQVRGIVETRELIKQKLKGVVDLQTILAQPLMVPESMTALDLIARFRNSSQELALVLDEYGGVSGIVSREDVFEAIVGDLPIAGDSPKKWQLQKREDGTWLVDGTVPIEEFKDRLEIDERLPGEGEEDYATVAGFVLYQLERVPAEGDTFEWKIFHFEVVDMDRHRIDKIIVRKK
jgi:putative hemolysin